jgi:hypothetical protein
MFVELDFVADAKDCRFDCVSATTVDSNAAMWLEAEIVPKTKGKIIREALETAAGDLSSLHPTEPSDTLAGIVFARAVAS